MAFKQVSVASIGTPDKDGFLTKQGGRIKTWKRRYFALKGQKLYYFKGTTDTEQTGVIDLATATDCKEDGMRGGKHYFAVTTPQRRYLMYSGTQDEAKAWVERIKASMKGETAQEPPKPTTTTTNDPAPSTSTPAATTTTTDKPADPKPATTATSSGGGSDGTARARMASAKESVPFLQGNDTKVVEFWQIWCESVPASDELEPGLTVSYHLSASADLEKLTWRTAGPQSIFIQKMVDFFWNVGAPESEIDRLNDVGALVNPAVIGSWIDMSAAGGMDGGWYFPVVVPLSQAIEACDQGEPANTVVQWAEKTGVTKAWSLGRDMGAAPPRQTEILINMPGGDRNTQVDHMVDAWNTFGFPPLSDDAVALCREEADSGDLAMSVITSTSEFVRIGVLVPKPSKEVTRKCCALANGRADDVAELAASISADGPAFAEFQHLKDGFGYGVYKEGFNVVFHFDIGEDSG